ncbi:hypothetical protein BB559_001795 [Furculomyces boomerangus]|uniref:DNA mismatch repair protein S5 domain-containing protein n=1 Tax=Furculomyces boomerangus TaxID=61424 RepID=A0A2T9Z0F1_9FUNG|nr:hypothetical protein BB559_001795 [Furculomyces boomerangus]
MANKLVQLNHKIIPLLIAGPVITSIIDIIKELIENSLDASSTSISISLLDYGISKIQVSDSGHAISNKDLAFFGLNGYTSKLSSQDDLPHIKTYGFRGQALHHIHTVSEKIIIVSRIPSDIKANTTILDHNTNTINNNPIFNSTREPGTTITVNKPLSKFPVRIQKLEKNKNKQLNSIKCLVSNYYLVHPNIRFLLENKNSNDQNQKSFKNNIVGLWQPMTHYEDAIKHVFGENALENDFSFEISSDTKDPNSEFFLVKNNLLYPSHTSKNTNATVSNLESIKDISIKVYCINLSNVQHSWIKSSGNLVFLNKRPILSTEKDISILLKTISNYIKNQKNNVYKMPDTTSNTNKQQNINKKDFSVVVYINIPSEMVDINVSPKKNISRILAQDFCESIKDFIDNTTKKSNENQEIKGNKNHAKREYSLQKFEITNKKNKPYTNSDISISDSSFDLPNCNVLSIGNVDNIYQTNNFLSITNSDIVKSNDQKVDQKNQDHFQWYSDMDTSYSSDENGFNGTKNSTQILPIHNKKAIGNQFDINKNLNDIQKSISNEQKNANTFYIPEKGLSFEKGLNSSFLKESNKTNQHFMVDGHGISNIKKKDARHVDKGSSFSLESKIKTKSTKSRKEISDPTKTKNALLSYWYQKNNTRSLGSQNHLTDNCKEQPWNQSSKKIKTSHEKHQEDTKSMIKSEKYEDNYNFKINDCKGLFISIKCPDLFIDFKANKTNQLEKSNMSFIHEINRYKEIVGKIYKKPTLFYYSERFFHI